jgi:hypothetical protein
MRAGLGSAHATERNLILSFVCCPADSALEVQPGSTAASTHRTTGSGRLSEHSRCPGGEGGCCQGRYCILLVRADSQAAQAVQHLDVSAALTVVACAGVWASGLSPLPGRGRHARSLSHPGIVRIYDYGEKASGHRPYLVLELVIGRSLARVLAFGPIEAARATDVIARTAASLHTARSAGLVHCDIKPANLLLGPGDQVKITDFGIARAAAPATAAGVRPLIGTRAYLAPERIDGAPPPRPATCTRWASTPGTA